MALSPFILHAGAYDTNPKRESEGERFTALRGESSQASVRPRSRFGLVFGSANVSSSAACRIFLDEHCLLKIRRGDALKKLLAGTLIAFATISPLWAQRPAGPGADRVARTIKVGDLSRTFYLHVPPKLPRDKAVPLVLMFHGGGGTPAFAERESKFSDLADREGFLVAYPEGLGKSWNDGRNNLTIVAQRDNIDDLGFVAALIDDVAKEHKVDAKRVFSTGISNGAIFSHHLAANLSSRIAAIAPVVGGLAETSRDKFQPEKPVAV